MTSVLIDTVRNALVHTYDEDALAALDRLEEQLETAQKQAFAGAEALQWVAATYPKVIDRMPRALMRALREADAPYPATDPLDYIELDEHGMCPHDYAKGLGCHVCDPAKERQ